MPIFKRRAGSGSSRKSSSSGPNGQGPGGIMIAAAGPIEPSLPPRIETQLPSADYHGTMVTPDAMRAHLRAQRARARAAGAQGAHFLTEAEEDEIIDQLRRQTYFGASDAGAASPEMGLQSSRLLALPDVSTRGISYIAPGSDGFGGLDSFAAANSDGFGGTDGFGGWGGGSSSSATTANRVSESLTESLGNLSRGPGRGEASLFSARGSERDNAYLRNVDKGRSSQGNSIRADPPPISTIEEEEAEEASRLSEEAMPGDFLAASRRASRIVEESHQVIVTLADTDSLPPPMASDSARNSQLLTNLSPEAFKRVSTALEEVYGIVAGRVDEGDMRKDDDEEIDDDDEEEDLFDGASPPTTDQIGSVSQGKFSQRGGSRKSTESDERSFASAHSDVVASVAHWEDDEVQSTLSSSGLAPSESERTLRSMPPTMHSAHTATQATASSGPASTDASYQTSPMIPPLNGHVRATSAAGNTVTLRRSSSSNSTSSLAASRTRGAGLVSLDPANGRLKLGPASPTAETYASARKYAPVSTERPSFGNMGEAARSTSPRHQLLDGTSSSYSLREAALAAISADSPTNAHASWLPSSEQTQRPTEAVIRRPSATSSSGGASTPVLSANAIAARSQHYFPHSASSIQSYAGGFRAAPASASALAAATGTHVFLPAQGSSWSEPEANGTTTALSSLLVPGPPVDADQAEQWRQRYGAKSSDTVSIRSGSSDLADSDDEREDGDDVWAKVTRNTGRSDTDKMRPVSSIPPEAAASHLAGAGITVDQMAEMQRKLVRSAGQHTATPVALDARSVQGASQAKSPLPYATSQHQPSLSLQHTSPIRSATPQQQQQQYATPGTPKSSHQTSPSLGFLASPTRAMSPSSASSSKLDKARERARMLADRQKGGGGSLSPRSSDWSLDRTARGEAEDGLSERTSAQPFGSDNSPLGPQRSFKSQVMYDVTTSHRPTSPPPRASLSNLPTLHDLSMSAQSSSAFQPIPSVINPDRQSVSLASIMEATATRAQNDWAADNGPSAIDGQGRSGSLGQTIYDTAVMQTRCISQEQSTHEAIGMGEADYGLAIGHALPRSQSHDILSAAAAQSSQLPHPNAASPRIPRTTQTAWSDPGDNDNLSRLPQSQYLTPALVDDIEAQTRAATVALKGTDAPGRAALPLRSKSLSNRKGKKLSKFVSQPQLIQTSQRLEHAEPIVRPDATLVKRAGGPIIPAPTVMRTTGNRDGHSAVTDYARDSQTATSATIVGHRRRSSSFGHQGQLDSAWDVAATTTSQANSSPQSSALISTPERSTGSIGRLLSRVRSRKQSDVGRHPVDPFPTSFAAKSSPSVNIGGGSAWSNDDARVTRGGVSKPMPTLPVVPPRSSKDATTLSDLFLSAATSSLPPSPPTSSQAKSEINTSAEGYSALESSGVPVASASSTALLGSPALIQDAWTKSPEASEPSPSEARTACEPDFIARAQKRKSLRDTIVRRTIIIPTVVPSVDERRKSGMSTLSRRSRKPGGVDDSAPMPPEGWQQYQSRLSTESVRAADNEDSGSRAAAADAAGLKPPPSPRAYRSNTQSSYAGSLYDMYSGDPGNDQTPLPERRSVLTEQPTGLAADGGTGRNHIEVTERADGSVVWQVIAGLADRSSAYSGGGHSRGVSESSIQTLLRERDSMTESPLPAESGSNGPVRSFAGLTNDDSRSFFARSRGSKSHRKSFSYDANACPPLPGLPEMSPNSGSNEVRELAEDESYAMPPFPVAPLATTNKSSEHQLGFDMATPTADATSTRIVYTSDQDLAAMLESLARDNAAAKFEFSRVPGNAGFLEPSQDAARIIDPSRPPSTWTGGSADQFYAQNKRLSGEIRNHRLRVEAEIFSLLSQNSAI